MKYNFIFIFLLISSFAYTQEKPKKLGFYTTLHANFGYDIAAMLRQNRAQSDDELYQLEPGRFNYGFTSQVGYQPFNWFALSGGLRYSYIDPNFHILYVMAQPNFILKSNNADDYLFLFGNLGTKINSTAAKKADFIGIGIGKTEKLTKHLGHQFQVSADAQYLDNTQTFFLSISYGLMLFSNKNE